MANDAGLHGRLADFTLEEILQLIALQQKTGLLAVDASYPMTLAFESGMLVGYRDTRRGGIDPLEGFLKGYGYFPTESWEHVDYVARHSKLDLTEILVNEGLLTAEELEQVQYDAAQEDIFRGMQLRDGRYQFVPGRDGLAGLMGRVRIKVDGLLMEAVRRIDEISGLRERFFSQDLKIRRSNSEVDVSQRSAAERRLLAVLGQENDLRHVIAKGRMAEFDALSTLDQLRADGVILVQSLPRAKDVNSENKTAERGPRLHPQAIRIAVTVSVVVIVGLGLVAWSPWSGYRSAQGNASLEDWTQRREHAQVAAAIQLFEKERGRAPKSIEDLVHAGWVDAELVARVSRTHEYRVDGGSWSLQPIDPADTAAR